MSNATPPSGRSPHDPPRDPPTTRRYDNGEIALRVRDLPGQGTVNVHIEHRSGAALMAPACEKFRTGRFIEIRTTGFDGTDYRITIDDADDAPAAIEASRSTPILGGATRCLLPRRGDPRPARPIRGTGDEDTVPISTPKRDKH